MGFYLDTSIWLDVYENRGENGVVAIAFLKKFVGVAQFLYSDQVSQELKQLGYSRLEIRRMLSCVFPLKKISPQKIHFSQARDLCHARSVPNKDALHAILSRDHEAQLISRDRHFERLKDVSEARLPEDFI